MVFLADFFTLVFVVFFLVEVFLLDALLLSEAFEEEALVFAEAADLLVLVFLLRVACVFEDAFLAEFFALPGNARQCALVLLPFLFTDDLRHVHSLLFAEHIELLKPEHWLAALAEPATEKPNMATRTNTDLLILYILFP